MKFQKIQLRDTILHSQLQEELKYELMKSPAVSGALSRALYGCQE